MGSRPWRARLRRGSISGRLWRGLAVFTLLIISAGALIAIGLAQQDHAVDRAIQRLQPLERANLQLRADFAGSQAQLRAYIITREPRFLSFYRASRRSMARTFALGNGLMTGTSRAEWRAQLAASRVWYGYARRMAGLPAGSPELARLTDASYASAYGFYQANNRLHRRLDTESHGAILEGQAAVDRAALTGGILAGAAVLLGLAAAVGTVRGVSKPMSRLVATLQRLTAGDNTARAEVTGPVEVEQVAVSINALADEGDRLRAQERESSRLRTMARDVGYQIREHLRAEEVINAARAALEANIDTDVVYLHLVDAGQISPPVGHEDDWVLPADFTEYFPAGAMAQLHRIFANQASMVIQDMWGEDASTVPPAIREALRQAGVVSRVLTPFGVGSEMLGFIVACRLHPGHSWTRPEIDAIESIAADLGRGLHHARMYEAENRLVEELTAVDRAKSDFLATVSHELRTPLTSIAGYVEILRDREAGELNETQQRILETVDRNTDRLRHLIEDVLTLSRIESGTFKTAMQPVNLADITAAAVSALQPAAAGKEVAISLSCPDDLVVAGDPGQLDRVLMNLLSNAVKFTPADGSVHVSVASSDSTAVVRIRDTGIGIPERDQKRLFTRFFRASNAVERSIPGTGLGMAIVRTIVDNHGGQIGVESREGAGTTVTVQIPLLAAADLVRPGPPWTSAAGAGPWPGLAPQDTATGDDRSSFQQEGRTA